MHIMSGFFNKISIPIVVLFIFSSSTCTKAENNGLSMLFLLLFQNAISPETGTGPGSGTGPSLSNRLNWSSPVNIAPSFGSVSSDYAADMNEKGDVIVAYFVNNKTAPFTGHILNQTVFLYASVRVNGVWKHPAGAADTLNICSDSPGDCGQVHLLTRVHMDENGKASVFFLQKEPTNTYIQLYRAYFDGNTWTKPTAPVLSVASDSVLAYLVSAESGDAVMIWTQNGNYISRYQSGTWTDPADSADNESNLIISATGGKVLLNNGDLIQTTVNSPYQTGKIETFTDVFSTPIASPSSTSFSLPGKYINMFGNTLAVNNSGNGVAIWQLTDSSFLAGPYRIALSTRENGVWTHPASADLSSMSMDKISSQAVINASGQSFIGHSFDIASSEGGVYTSSNVSGAWTTPSAQSENHMYYSTIWIPPASVDIDSNGNAVLSWTSYDNAGLYRAFNSDFRSDTWADPIGATDSLGISKSDQNIYSFLGNSSNTGFIIWKSYVYDPVTYTNNEVLTYSEYIP